MVLTFPNHHGIYGRIMRSVAPDRYAMHNQMSLQDALAAVHTLGGVEVMGAAHLGRIGFGTSRLYVWAARSGRLWSKFLSLLLKVVERFGCILPNSSKLSPHVLLVLRKRGRRS